MGGGTVELLKGFPFSGNKSISRIIVKRWMWDVFWWRKIDRKREKRVKATRAYICFVYFAHIDMLTRTDHSSSSAPLLLCIHDVESKYRHGAPDCTGDQEGRKGMMGRRGVRKKKRTRYLKYYTYQGKCSVEQALWECKLHSPLLPSGCRLLDDYNHPQHWAPRTTHCSIHRHRIAECWIECHDVCMFIKKYWSGTWILACSTGEIM